MSQPLLKKSGGGRNIKGGWVLAVVVALLIMWMIYIASQTSIVASNSGSMSGIDQGTSEISSSRMPDTMPGMNH